MSEKIYDTCLHNVFACCTSVAANYSFGDEGTAELASHLKHNKHLTDLQ